MDKSFDTIRNAYMDMYKPGNLIKAYDDSDKPDSVADGFLKDVLEYLEQDIEGIAIGEDSRVFYKGKYYEYNSETGHFELAGEGDAWDYCESASRDGITIMDEGYFSDLVEISGGIPDDLQKIADRHFHVFERATSWCFTSYSKSVRMITRNNLKRSLEGDRGLPISHSRID